MLLPTNKHTAVKKLQYDMKTTKPIIDSYPLQKTILLITLTAIIPYKITVFNDWQYIGEPFYYEKSSKDASASFNPISTTYCITNIINVDIPNKVRIDSDT